MNGWSKNTTDALHNWLAPDTWHKGEAAEDRRFNAFVGNVWRDTQKAWDEAEVREFIKRTALELHPDHSSEPAVSDRVSEGTRYLDFLSDIRDAGLLV